MSPRWFGLIALTALLSTTALAQSEEGEAGDTKEVDKESQEPLRDRIRPVSGHMFLKKGRFELSPSAYITVKDAFFAKYVFGAALNYHLLEDVAIGVRGGYSLNTVSGAASICTVTCRPPSYDELNGRAPGQITLLAGVEAQWAPIYGKIALLAESFLHFDLYAVGGVNAVQYRAPRPDGSAGSIAEWTPGGTIGAGGRIFLNRFLTLRVEARDLMYNEIIAPRPLTPQPTSFRHQIMVEVGVSLFFPLTFTEG